MSKFIAILVLLLAAAGVAQADDHGKDWGHHHTWAAPEIDLAAAGSALTLLAGGLAVVRGRRNKKK